MAISNCKIKIKSKLTAGPKVWKDIVIDHILKCLVEWPMLWRIMKNSLYNEGICKWINWAPIFFWYKLPPTTSGPQKFANIEVVKIDYFNFPGKIFEKLVWIRCLGNCLQLLGFWNFSVFFQFFSAQTCLFLNQK